jgi:hypothetical protein
MRRLRAIRRHHRFCFEAFFLFLVAKDYLLTMPLGKASGKKFPAESRRRIEQGRGLPHVLSKSRFNRASSFTASLA